ncbi:hypothetical protein ACQP2Y_21140 [Actinoplanes sp. CA-051413]|uniref:hypothetical protein n=1 Tax=Actinoplanes sp. CA-051413 TaxID=3239899 RepID=UPI003D99F785
MADIDAMTQAWGSTRRRTTEVVDKKVKLTDAPEISIGRKAVTPASITFRFTRIDGGTWDADVLVYADLPGSLIRTYFRPADYALPQWLTELIDSATPTD